MNKKKTILLYLFVLICSCGNGQTKKAPVGGEDVSKYPQLILGCWELVHRYFEIETNYPFVDSLVGVYNQMFAERDKAHPEITKFYEDGSGEDYSTGSSIRRHPFNYFIEGDSLSIDSGIRSDADLVFQITIRNDTLFAVASTMGDFKYFRRKMLYEQEIAIPKDLECEKVVRYGVAVRIDDCEKYERENEEEEILK